MTTTSASGAGAHETIVAGDEREHAALAAEIAARAIRAAIEERGAARVALSGGSTPSPAYRALAALDLPWERVTWLQVDERAVPPDHARSNVGAIARALGPAVTAASGGVRRMEAEDPNLGAAAARYEALLRERFGVASAVAFDLIVLGVGEDGHTASLFPGTGAVAIDDRLVAAIPAQPAKGLEARLTLTAPVLVEARAVLVLARGASKRLPIVAARSPGPEDEIPARVLLRARGRVTWLLDHGAAG